MAQNAPNFAGRRRLALWHARQLNNCSGNSICEAQHHISTYLYAKEVRSQFMFGSSVRDLEQSYMLSSVDNYPYKRCVDRLFWSA